MLIEALDLRELQGGLEQGVEHMEAGFVSGKPGTLDFHAAKASDVDRPVRATAPRAAPLLKLSHFARTMFNEIVHHILLAQPVAACDRVVEMILKTVMILCNGRRTAFGGDGMTTHRIDF